MKSMVGAGGRSAGKSTKAAANMISGLSKKMSKILRGHVRVRKKQWFTLASNLPRENQAK
jgi:hypothetical protein